MYVGVLCVSVGVCVWVEIVDCVSNALPDRCHRWAALNGGNAAKRIGERKKEKLMEDYQVCLCYFTAGTRPIHCAKLSGNCSFWHVTA